MTENRSTLTVHYLYVVGKVEAKEHEAVRHARQQRVGQREVAHAVHAARLRVEQLVEALREQRTHVPLEQVLLDDADERLARRRVQEAFQTFVLLVQPAGNVAQVGGYVERCSLCRTSAGAEHQAVTLCAIGALGVAQETRLEQRRVESQLEQHAHDVREQLPPAERTALAATLARDEHQ